MPSLASWLAQYLIAHTIGTSVVDDIGLAQTPESLKLALERHSRKDQREPPASVARTWEVETLEAGAPLHLLQKNRAGVLLYLHGGAYVLGPNTQQWRVAAALADDAELDLAVLDYALGPQGTVESAIAASVASLDVLSSRYDVVTVLGDSAGGGLALAALQAQRDLGGQQPALTLLFSPWVDAALAAPDLDQELDVLLSIEGLRGCARLFAGGLPLEDARLSPLNGSLQGLPRIVTHVGTQELMLPDARRLHAALDEVRVDNELHEHEGMFHDFMLFPSRESRQVLDGMASLLRQAAAG